MRSRRDQCSSADTVTQVTCPSYVTDNEADRGSTGQGNELSGRAIETLVFFAYPLAASLG